MRDMTTGQEGYGPLQNRLEVSFVVVAGLAMSVGLLGCGRSEETEVSETLNIILKYEGDVRKAEAELKDYLSRKKAATETKAQSNEKDLLH